MNDPPPLNGDYDRDPNMRALKRRGLLAGVYIRILRFRFWDVGFNWGLGGRSSYATQTPQYCNIGVHGT